MAKSKAQSLADSIKALKGGKATPAPKTEKLKKAEVITPPKPAKKNGGKRAGSGRKPKIENLIARGVHQMLDAHVNEEVEVKIPGKDGTTVVIKKPRIVIVMQKLFEMATSQTPSHEAGSKWLDRAVGRPMQPIEHRGDKDKPLRIVVDI